MTNPRGISAIDARNGCYGNEEATADDGVLEVSCGEIHAEGVMRTASPNAASELQDLNPAGQPERCGLALRDGDAAFDSQKAKLTASTKAEVSGLAPPAGINPKYDGNLLPAMTAMVTGFVDKLTQERAKLFRESTRALLPEFAHLLKHEGGRNEIE